MLREACGIHTPEGIPSAFAYSRLVKKLQQPRYILMVKNIMRDLTRRLYDTFPDFGKSVAIDSTDLKAYANGRKTDTDPDAGWIVKMDTQGRRKYIWGYKVHALSDTAYELPIAINVTSGNVNDVTRPRFPT